MSAEKTYKREHIVAAVSYLTFVGWVIAFILHMDKKKQFSSVHIRQALIVNLISLIPVIGQILFLIFAIWGLYLVYEQRKEYLPLFGEPSQKWFRGI